MKRIISITTLCWAVLSYGLTPPNFTPSTPSSESENDSGPQEEGMTLPDYISQIAEKDDITAADYANMADGTMQVAMQVMQQGEKMPDAPIRDALDAVAAGRALNPEETDWDKIEQRLLDLLNPPHQDQQQQQQQDSQDQEQQQDGEQKEQDGSSSSSEESGEDSEQGEEGEQGDNSQEQQDGEKGDQGEPQEGQEGEQQSQDGQDQQSGEQSEDGESTQMPNTQDGAQMGELNQNQEEQQVELDGDEQQPQQASQEQMQTLGGQQTTGEPIDAETAALRQLLEQLKQQDQPGKLYQILQEAQSGGKKKQQPNTKDW